MAENESLRAELGAMREELARAEPGKGDDQPPLREPSAAPNTTFVAEIETVLHELQSRWGEASDDAEQLVKDHPLASVVSAFLLGVLVGRATGRH